jgi:hypothetical protein
VALHDLLHHLGWLAGRPPLAALNHAIAQFLHVRGVLPSARPHSESSRRPDSDLAIWKDVSERLEAMLHAYEDAVPA